MTIAEIIAAIRRGIREPSPVTVSDSDITAVVNRGVTLLGQLILGVDPSFLEVRKSISSYTNVFSKPSDCLIIRRLWDLGDDAVAISGAADNGSGLVQITTSAAHGFSDGDIVLIHDVAGCTEANGTWQIDYDTTTHATTEFDLLGSTFTNTYTSGGYVFEEPSDPDEITKIDPADANLNHENKWYPRGTHIVVDDSGFTNDLIIDYIAMPDGLSDIQSSFHEWLISFGIVDLMTLNTVEAEYQDKIKTVRFHEGRMITMTRFIQENYQSSSEPSYIRDVMGVE